MSREYSEGMHHTYSGVAQCVSANWLVAELPFHHMWIDQQLATWTLHHSLMMMQFDVITGTLSPDATSSHNHQPHLL